MYNEEKQNKFCEILEYVILNNNGYGMVNPKNDFKHGIMSDKTSKILIMYYGLFSEEKHSIKEIAEYLNVTSAYVSENLKKGLRLSYNILNNNGCLTYKEEIKKYLGLSK